MPYIENRKKYYPFKIDFESEKDRDDFKNYVHHIKTGKGIPIYKIVNDMLKLHKMIQAQIDLSKKIERKNK